MRNELSGTTAVATGTVGVPDSDHGDTLPTSPVVTGNNLPPNEPNGDLAVSWPNGATTLTPESTGPPNTNDYWFGLITEQDAAAFMKMTTRWFQAKRQHGGGPIFVRISQRCIRYRRIDLKAYAERQLRLSTSDDGRAVDVT